MAEEKTTKVKTASQDPWDQKVKIHLDRAPRGEDNFVIASFCGRSVKVMRGVDVEVPLPIAMILENSKKAEENADNFIDANVDKNEQ